MRRLWLVLWLTLISASAWAQNDLAEAKRLFRAGARAYDAGQFAAAAQAFEQAYELSPRAPLRFSAGQALRRLYTVSRELEHLKKARRYYQQYVDEVKTGGRIKDAVEALGEIDLLIAKASPEPQPGEGEGERDEPVLGRLQLDSIVPGAVAIVAGRAPVHNLPRTLDLPPGTYSVTMRADGYLDQTRTVRVTAERLALFDPPMAEMRARVSLAAPGGAEILVDGRPAGRAPLARPLELSSGKHRIVVGQTGYEVFTEDLTLARGESRELEADLGMTTQRIASWVVLGGAAATTSAAIVLAILGAAEQRDARRLIEATNGQGRALTAEEGDTYNGHIEARDNFANLAGATFALGAVAAVVGLVMFSLDEPQLYAAAAAEDEADDGEKENEKEPVFELDATAAPVFERCGSDLCPGAGVVLRGRF